jgi:membrane protein involved in colicin uptake
MASSSEEEEVDEAAERFEAAAEATEKAHAQAQAAAVAAASAAPAAAPTTVDVGERPFINSAIDFFACIGTGNTLEVDNESGMFSPEALHEVSLLGDCSFIRCAV